MSDAGEDRVREILDGLRRTMVHYGLWFAGAVRELGVEGAIRAEREAGDRWLEIAARRLGKALGRDLVAELASLEPGRLAEVSKTVSINWLAADGVWFQALEHAVGGSKGEAAGMAAAKRVNDGCWAVFSPLEAARIRALAELPDEPLPALKEALNHRLYARINEQEVVEEDENGFTFRMVRCRVQDARKRKGLPDYPCKSGGVVEYTEFAKAIDPRIKTTCIACPPDDHPEDWYCSWRFELA